MFDNRVVDHSAIRFKKKKKTIGRYGYFRFYLDGKTIKKDQSQFLKFF